jgi:hypothetical protein
MANRLLGEASARAAGRIWTLRLDFNALCAFEDATGVSAFDLLSRLEADPASLGARQVRALVHACMLHHHPAAQPSDAGEILSEDFTVLQRLAGAALPQAEDAAPGAAGSGAAGAAGGAGNGRASI